MAIDGTEAYAMVTGTVFCDQCKDGQISLFDYPLYGMKVGMACAGSDGQTTIWREETTNWFGSYAMRFDGTPDLRNCYAQVSGTNQGSTGCGAAAGPSQSLRLMFRMFDMEIYTVDPLLSQPAQPMNWTMPQYSCFWKMVNQDTKVTVVFGPLAAARYGTDMTLWGGLQGRGNLYRTLLREATTALLNSYNSIQFAYSSLSVIGNLNAALMGSPREALLTALRFRRANSGFGRVPCRFSHCNLGLVLKEATLQDIQIAFRQGQITSEQLVDYYLEQIRALNPVVHGVLELNPDAITLAKSADYQRKTRKVGWSMSLHGIPILVKDTIATYDKLNTTAGSFALLGSRVPRDAGVVAKLRRAGAIVLGKSTLSEWAVSGHLLLLKVGVQEAAKARPICRTVADAVQVLDAIVGIDPRDSATIRASRYIPPGGYKKFLKADGLRGKRLGIAKREAR
ncbi:hypothetical protein RJ641_019548 [Dillenia turbinata]|uniref:Amidase domain-containing protein n=1 Tax=Dillenia turbinata TaxID=194707 RepID=A0AAN8UTV6_9MAGN